MPECIIYLLKKENNYDWLYNIIVKQECQNPLSNNYIHILVENQQRQKNSLDLIGRKSYIISMPAIFSFGLFTELLNCRRPYLRRWPKEKYSILNALV